MADIISDSGSARITTLETLQGYEKGQSTSGIESTLSPDPVTAARFERAVRKLEDETAQVGGKVFVAVGDRDVSLLQSEVAEKGDSGPPLPGGGIEAQFGEGLTGGDVWGWFRSLFDHVDSSRWHPIARPAGIDTEAIADVGRIALLSDWGTNLYGAPVSAASIARTGNYEMLMHLGDIYYSGTEKETRDRFLSAWPKAAGRVNRALNGNHEMYSGGFAYFDHVLPDFRQTSSYFAFRNANWLLVALDTAHTDHAIDAAQEAWLEAVAARAGGRKVVLFSHHQPFSRLDAQGPKLQEALGSLLRRRAIAAWYWGHEHDCVIYDRHPEWGFLGRCIGNGGIPSPRKDEVKDAPVERTVGAVAWHRLNATEDSPSCLVLDGPNPLVPEEEEKFGPHGYVTLAFDGPALVERVHLPDGTVIFEGNVA